MFSCMNHTAFQKPATASGARAAISPTSDMFARFLPAGEGHGALTKSFINAVLEDSGGHCVQTIELKSPFNLARADDKEIIPRRQSVRLGAGRSCTRRRCP